MCHNVNIHTLPNLSHGGAGFLIHDVLKKCVIFIFKGQANHSPRTPEPLRMKAVHSFEMLRVNNCVTQPNNSQDQNS